jgi:hypothetical protein
VAGAPRIGQTVNIGGFSEESLDADLEVKARPAEVCEGLGEGSGSSVT